MCSPVPLLAPLEPLPDGVDETIVLASASADMLNNYGLGVTSDPDSTPQPPREVLGARSECLGGETFSQRLPRCSATWCCERGVK